MWGWGNSHGFPTNTIIALGRKIRTPTFWKKASSYAPAYSNFSDPVAGFWLDLGGGKRERKYGYELERGREGKGEEVGKRRPICWLRLRAAVTPDYVTL